MRFVRAEVIIVWVLVIAMAVGALCMYEGIAYADEPSQGETPAQVDYSSALDEISGKLDELATGADVSDLVDAIGSIPQVDNVMELSDIRKALIGLNAVEMFLLVSNLILIGVVLSLVFLVSYRSHT